MPNTSSAPLVFYPAYCFALSPTYNRWAGFSAADIHVLRERAGFEGQKLYFHLNHPIRWIRIVGLIVNLEIYPNRISLILDDSSGSTVEVKCNRKAPPICPSPAVRPLEQYPERGNKPPVDNFEEDMRCQTESGRDLDLKGIDIGSLLKIKGGLGSFRGEMQVLPERISIIQTTTEEALVWAEDHRFRHDVLNHPWIVSPDELERAQRKAQERHRRRKVRTDKGRGKAAEGPGRRPQQTDEIRRREMENRQRLKDAAERREGDEADRKLREEEMMRKIEEDDRRREEEEMRRIEEENKRREEEESRQREEDERKRKADEERERIAVTKKRRNEARERALREMGAGR